MNSPKLDGGEKRSARSVAARRARCLLKLAAFLAFSVYVITTVLCARGPAIDIAFDLVVYLALVRTLLRRWMRGQPASEGRAGRRQRAEAADAARSDSTPGATPTETTTKEHS